MRYIFTLPVLRFLNSRRDVSESLEKEALWWHIYIYLFLLPLISIDVMAAYLCQCELLCIFQVVIEKVVNTDCILSRFRNRSIFMP